jgi:hypothetical protein
MKTLILCCALLSVGSWQWMPVIAESRLTATAVAMGADLAQSNSPEAYSDREKDFMAKQRKLMDDFKSKRLDTTLYSFCLIDNDDKTDTLATRIYEDSSAIVVQYSWVKNGMVCWSASIKDPYLWVGASRQFQYDVRSKWVTFTVGVVYAIAGVHPVSEHKSLVNGSVEAGLRDLKAKGFEVDKNKYRHYVTRFKGDLISWGHPESSNGLHIWYEPLKMFVCFYCE